MQKVRLEIQGIAYSQTQSGSYVLTLIEAAGNRKLPIVIGGFEAQAIAVELEKMIPNRPLTHDLFKSFCVSYDVTIKEVLIYKFEEGVFYCHVILPTVLREHFSTFVLLFCVLVPFPSL